MEEWIILLFIGASATVLAGSLTMLIRATFERDGGTAWMSAVGVGANVIALIVFLGKLQ